MNVTRLLLVHKLSSIETHQVTNFVLLSLIFVHSLLTQATQTFRHSNGYVSQSKNFPNPLMS